MGLKDKLKKGIVGLSLVALTSCTTTPKIHDFGDGKKESVHNYDKLHVLLICGDKHKDFVNQTKQAYEEFRKLGVSDEDIHLLAPEGIKKLEGIVDATAYKHNVILELASMKYSIDEDDIFFFYFVDHGVRIKGYTIRGGDSIDKDVVFPLQEEYTPAREYLPLNERVDGESGIALPHPWFNKYADVIFENELEALVKDVNSKSSIFFIDACFSGGFSSLAKGKNIVMATVDKNNKSFIASDLGENFMEALNYIRKADKNDDGLVSVKEAFKYAMKNDEYSRGPRLPWRWFFPRPEISYDEIDPDEVFLKKLKK